MAFFDFLWQYFSGGGGVEVIVWLTIFVSYVFAVTFTVGLFAVEAGAAGKRFFVWFGDLGVVGVFACASLDAFSAGRLGLFYSAVAIFGSTLLFYIEYGILALQAKICKRIMLKRKREEDEVQSVPERTVEVKSPAKRTKIGGVVEVPLRERVKRQMENGFSTRLGERYLYGCIERLEKKGLSEGELSCLDKIKQSLSVSLNGQTAEDRRAVSEGCGRLITLMAKYF